MDLNMKLLQKVRVKWLSRQWWNLEVANWGFAVVTQTLQSDSRKNWAFERRRIVKTTDCHPIFRVQSARRIPMSSFPR